MCAMSQITRSVFVQIIPVNQELRLQAALNIRFQTVVSPLLFGCECRSPSHLLFQPSIYEWQPIKIDRKGKTVSKGGALYGLLQTIRITLIGLVCEPQCPKKSTIAS